MSARPQESMVVSPRPLAAAKHSPKKWKAAAMPMEMRMAVRIFDWMAGRNTYFEKKS